MDSNDGADPVSRAAALQDRYTELLEKRIAQLELALKTAVETANGGSEPPTGAGVADDKTDDKKDDSDSRYRNILRKWDRNTGVYKDEVVGANFFLEKQSKDVAYTFSRIYDPASGEKSALSQIEIEDPALIQVLKNEIGKYPGVNLDSGIITMQNPFSPLVHNWEKLNKRAAQDPESQTSKDLSNLLDRVQTAPELQDYFKVRESNLASKVVTFNTLWTVFVPGTLVVARLFQNVAQIFKIVDAPIPVSRGPYSMRQVTMWASSWDWNGKKLVRVEYELNFEWFRGTKVITELPYYPLMYHEDPERLLREARARARCASSRPRPGAPRAPARCFATRAWPMASRGISCPARTLRRLLSLHKDNEGAEQRQTSDDSAEPLPPKVVQVKGEILVDPEAFLQYGTGIPPLGELYTASQIIVDELHSNTVDYDEFARLISTMDIDAAELDPDNDNFAIFPPRVLGYATREKVWGQFNLDLMKKPLGMQADKFDDNLQLDPKYKTLIKALVESHMESNSKFVAQVEDVVEEKGKGLVLLLHGPPGVGKTLTAETIAQATAKPLVVVSVAEIGLDASRAERNLEKLFNLATKWEAILLVDEADVFLETRGATSSASRNALVSVLLRVLEYYRGIIILTTNRIKSIDIAVISRIHLAIRYEDLSDSQMKSIFKYFLDQLEPGCIADRCGIDSFINSFGNHYGLNGRQIRNVVSAALAAARHEASNPVSGEPVKDGRLTFEHLKAVCEMTRAFQEQLKENTRQQRYINEAMRP
ncbi:putative 26S protease regulatory subunit [Podospora appendiculata]|uniref:26S protease regulatory subunit n=1 Tax=Podospora appendiculata TaxID=314037 RepID=A0AAE0XD07_9PEZI|nr:putative 26S protease regulatory subunit [Podospora appendiculata]